MSPFAEFVSLAEAARHAPAWRDLAARAEPNAFAEPEFVLPALRRFGGARLLFVWADERLIATAAVAPSRWRLGLARIWRHEQAALPALLIDRERSDEAWRQIVIAVRRAFPFAAGLLSPWMSSGAPAFANIVEGNALSRAAFPTASPQPPQSRRLKEWKRLDRRLAERGAVNYKISADLGAFERFLKLEAAGWKGQSGTALAQSPARAAFAREMAEGFLSDGRLSVPELTCDGATIACGVVLRSGRRAFFWKTAYAEDFARFSPGVLLTLWLGPKFRADVDEIDSCAVADHPMISHVWPDRIDFADFAIPTSNAAHFAAALAVESLAQGARHYAKRAALPLLKRKRS